MRKPASIRIFVLAALLAVSHVVVASHVTAHLKPNVSDCECCICQGQTFAAPLTTTQTFLATPQLRTPLRPIRITLLSETVSRPYQSRAPPAVL